MKILQFLILLMLLSWRGFSGDTPTIKVRFNHPVIQVSDHTLKVDVEMQADRPGLQLFGMNVRFIYDDTLLEFISFGDFIEHYGPINPDPPLVQTGGTNSGTNFGFSGSLEFVNGSIQLLSTDQPVFLAVTEWNRIFSITFKIDDVNILKRGGNFCPPVLWDLEENPANGGFFTGDGGVVITCKSNDQAESIPCLVNVLSYNWNFDGITGLPHGSPVSSNCSMIPANNIPIARAGADHSVNSDALVTLDGAASSDTDGNLLHFSWTAPEGIVLMESGSSHPYFTSPSVTQNTQLTFLLKVNDGIDDSPFDTLKITIVPYPQYFNPGAQVPGLRKMEINIQSLKIDGVNMDAGDEIAVFDGARCVGASVFAGPVSIGNYLSMILYEGGGNGYIAGDSILYKVYDKDLMKEHTVSYAFYESYHPDWPKVGKFQNGIKTFVSLECVTTVNFKINLTAGWNIISLCVVPQNENMLDIFQPLISSGRLIKVQDEIGNSLEDWGILGGWINNIGNVSVKKGYKVKVNNDCQLTVPGVAVTLPIDLSLRQGWNIIGYPNGNQWDGLEVVRSLINRNTLIKIQDDLGNSIEDWGILGGWVNNIGNFRPGDGYKIKVLNSETLTIYDTY